jgi:hypothetical protein
MRRRQPEPEILRQKYARLYKSTNDLRRREKSDVIGDWLLSLRPVACSLLLT